VPQDRNWSFVSCDRSGTGAFVNVSAVEETFGCLEDAELASFFLALADMVYSLGTQHEIPALRLRCCLVDLFLLSRLV